MKLVLPFVESMVVRACNLSCQGCTTFSDLAWSGYETWTQGRAQIEPWTQRLDIQAWGVMGGEPLINPYISDWLTGIRELLPGAQIRFVTNGLLLARNWHVVELLSRLGNCVLKISRHISDPDLDACIDRIRSGWAWRPVREFGIDRWLTDNDFRFQITQTKTFWRTFRNDYTNMQPHDSSPQAAFAACCQQRCPMIWQGRLYKCGTAALTPAILDRFDRPNWQQWLPYVDTGLAADCTQQDLARFVANFGQAHSMCRQCPTANDLASRVDHTITVTRK